MCLYLSVSVVVSGSTLVVVLALQIRGEGNQVPAGPGADQGDGGAVGALWTLLPLTHVGQLHDSTSKCVLSASGARSLNRSSLAALATTVTSGDAFSSRDGDKMNLSRFPFKTCF